MEIGLVVVSPEALIRILIILLYAPICLVTYRRLFPRLTPSTKRLASILLAAQVLAIVISLEVVRPITPFERWFWDFEGEWNLPATFSSTQMALVAGVSLSIALLARAQPAFQRTYFVGLGLSFLFFALDEYFVVHEQIYDWSIYYAAVGVALAIATLMVAARSPWRERILYFSLLIGLAIGAIGAMVFNFMLTACFNLEFDRIAGCVPFFFGESLELLGTWLLLVALFGILASLAPSARKRRIQLSLYSLLLLWILLLIFDPFMLRLELRFLAQPTAIVLESDTNLHGYRLDNRGHNLNVILYSSTKHRNYLQLGYSIHLVDQVTGDSIASRDKGAGHQMQMLLDPNYVHVYRQRMELDLPPSAPVNRALWVLLTLWQHIAVDESLRQKVISSDHQQLSETQVVLKELVIQAEYEAPSAALFVSFDNGFTLDAVDMPTTARAGETLAIPFAWRSDVDGSEDHIQFLHLGHEESGSWWAYDLQPLGARLPTRLWYSGLADSETWQVPLPAELAPGRYTVYTGLYRASDKERVPASDVDGSLFVDARVPLGILILE